MLPEAMIFHSERHWSVRRGRVRRLDGGGVPKQMAARAFGSSLSRAKLGRLARAHGLARPAIAFHLRGADGAAPSSRRRRFGAGSRRHSSRLRSATPGFEGALLCVVAGESPPRRGRENGVRLGDRADRGGGGGRPGKSLPWPRSTNLRRVCVDRFSIVRFGASRLVAREAGAHSKAPGLGACTPSILRRERPKYADWVPAPQYDAAAALAL